MRCRSIFSSLVFHPTILLLHDLFYRSDTAIESFIKVVQVVFHIQFMPALQVQSLQEFLLLGFRIFPCIKLLLVLLVKIVDRVSKCRSD
jgi:hypothetical protein